MAENAIRPFSFEWEEIYPTDFHGIIYTKLYDWLKMNVRTFYVALGHFSKPKDENHELKKK
jgi:hypothetical protein